MIFYEDEDTGWRFSNTGSIPNNSETKIEDYLDDKSSWLRKYFCYSPLGHIGSPCVFCGYEEEK